MICSGNLVSLWNTESIGCIGKHRSIGKKWFNYVLFNIFLLVNNFKIAFLFFSLKQLQHGETGVFSNLVSSNSSICSLIVVMSYGSICCKLCFTKLLIIILILFFNVFLSLHLKNISNNVSTISVYLESIIYDFITWNLLEYIWIASQIFILTGDMEINPGPRNNT